MVRLRLWSVLAVVMVAAVVVGAQTYQGRILGTVTDSSGGVVKGAKVSITNVETGASRNLETNEVGDYVAPNLAPGLYKVIVEATGFKKVERLGVRLEVAKDAHIDISLTPGDITQSIQITEEAPLIDTTTQTLGGTFSNRAINDLPLNGRDFQNLVVLRPGVQRYPGGGFLSISSNGNRPENNNFIFDGTDNNDPYYGTTVINAEGVQGQPGTILPIDAIQEFNAQENPPAEYGWKPGAIVNLGIKSGTNEVHGTGYYFARNSALDARNFFNPPPDPKRPLSQHQFGGSLGGPIRKNKTFIFGSYEGVRSQVSNSNLVTSPATVALGGATSNCTFLATGDCENSIVDALTDLANRPGFTVAAGTCGGAPVRRNPATNQLSLNPLSANLIGCGSFTGNGSFPGLFPSNDGSNSSGVNQVSSGFPNTNRMDAFIVKMDHRFNDQHSLTGRYFFGDSLQSEQAISVLRPEWRSTSDLRAQVVGANYTWVPSASWVNELKFGYNRFWQAILTADASSEPVATYGINTGVTNPVNFGMPTIPIGGFTQLGGDSGWPLLTTPNETYQFVDNVSYTRGKHTFRFGAEFRYGKTDNLRNRRGKGRIRFQNGCNTFIASANCDGGPGDSTPLHDFLAGFPDRGDIFVGDSRRHVSIKSFGWFFQDDWRITPRVTINAGIRYDLNSPIKERNNLIGNFDPAVGLQQVGVNIGRPYTLDGNNFAPRLGVAWDIFGTGKTVVRAGGGIIYEIPILAIFLGQNGLNNATTTGLNSIPTGAVGTNLFNNGGTIAAAARTQSGSTLNWSAAGPIFNIDFDCSPTTGTPCDILGIRRNLRTPYVINYTLNVQQAITNNLAFQVGYVGNRGVKLYSIRDINQVDPLSPAEDPILGCDHCEQDGRPFNSLYPFLGYINFMENGYAMDYHGLQLSLTQRPWRGLSYVLGYTWSHTIDFVSLQRAAQPQDSTNPRAERASGDNDIRHRFTWALSYDLPSYKSPAQLLEGWQINSIVVLQTGQPYSGIDFGNDTSLTGEFSDRWNLIGDPRSIPNFSPSGPVPITNVLAQPSCPPCFGNAGRNIFRGPNFRNWDFSVAKTTKINEQVSLQFRAEFFNVLNHTNLSTPAPPSFAFLNNDLSFLDTFGLAQATPDVAGANPVIGTGGPRNIQLGLKLRF